MNSVTPFRSNHVQISLMPEIIQGGKAINEYDNYNDKQQEDLNQLFPNNLDRNNED